MTSNKDLKKHIRARMERTGESYTAARQQLLRAREVPDDAAACDETVEMIVLKVNQRSARVRAVGEVAEVTMRSPELALVVPGQLATLCITRRWTWHVDAYASGKFLNVRKDVAALQLVPLPLEGGQGYDFDAHTEGYGDDERLAALWRKHGGRSRPAYELDAIAWEGRAAAEPGDGGLTRPADARSGTRAARAVHLGGEMIAPRTGHIEQPVLEALLRPRIRRHRDAGGCTSTSSR